MTTPGASVPRRKSATYLDGPAARRLRCWSGRVRPVRGSDQRLADARLDPPIYATDFRRRTLDERGLQPGELHRQVPQPPGRVGVAGRPRRRLEHRRGPEREEAGAVV